MKSLAIICDLYNPLLLIISLFLIYKQKAILQSIVFFLWIIIVAYVLMFIDIKFGLWKMFSLDYSTHTATAVGMIVFIGALIKMPLRIAMLVFSLVLYAVLMKVLGYHGYLDVITTTMVVVPLVLIGFKFINELWRSLPSE
jgi:hypothetical protein